MFLTFLTLLPLVGAVCLTFIPRENEGAIKLTALAIATADFLLSLLLWAYFKLDEGGMQFEYTTSWIESWGVNYHVGIDGISLLLYIMTTFLTAISILASWNIKKYVKEYMFAMLALSTGMLGVFIALDTFLYYVFWEFQLVPMYLIIGLWGGPRRIYDVERPLDRPETGNAHHDQRSRLKAYVRNQFSIRRDRTKLLGVN